MDRATGPASPSPVAHPHCDGGGGWPKVAPIPITRSDRDDLEEDEGDKSSKTKRKKKKRKKEAKEGGGGKWTFGGLFRRKKKKEEELECAKDSTEEDFGVEKFSPAKGVVFPPSPSTKRNKIEEEYPSERLGHPCTMHNGCVGCVVTGRQGRSRQRTVFGSGSDCRDSYGGSSLVRRDSSTSSHRERKELIKARVEAMREKLPKDSSSEEEYLPGGSEGSWEWRGRKIPLPVGGVPHGSVGSAGSSPYLGRRSRFVGRTERFHQRRLSREFRDEGEEEEVWRRRPNGLPPQCVPWRASQSDVEAPYIGCRMMSANSGTTELGGSAVSYSPAQSPLQSPVLSGRRSASSATSPGYARETSGMPFHGGNRCVPRRYPSTPLSQQSHVVEGPTEGKHISAYSTPHYPMRSRSTDVLLNWRPEEGNYHGSEPKALHYSVKQSAAQRPTHEPPQFHQRWPPTSSGRSPPPPPPPRDPQRRLTNPQSLSQFQIREQAPTNDGYVRRHYPQQPPYSHVQQENPYMNVQNPHVHPPIQGASHPQGVTCLADSQPRSRRPLRVTAGGYVGRSAEMSYMSDSQVGPNVPTVRKTLTQHPPLESHYAIPFLADSPPPRCVINRVLREPQLAESVVHNPRPLMRQQRAPVFSRSRSSSPAPSGVNNRPALLPLRPFDNSNDPQPFVPRGHSSAPQTPIDCPMNRPLSIVSEEKSEVSTKVPPLPPARSSSRRSSISSLEAIEYGMWGMDRNSRQPNKGPIGLEDALTELENIYKSLKFEDDVDGETDSVLMGSSETGATYDDQDRPLTDDMAYRRLHSKEKTSGQQGVGGVVARAGSYLLVSPTLGPADPWTEPPPNSINPGEPDVTLDDVVFRSIRQANAHIPADPQPPFGIPLGPVTRAPDSDYLHAKPPSPSPTATRMSSSARKTPDVVKDDLAFRSLRKDRPTNGSPIRPVPLRGVSSPPPRPSSSISCISSPPPLPNTGIDFQAIRKKRAVRSLSANLLGILQTTSLTTRPLSPPPVPKTQLPPPSPTSPRKEVKSMVFLPSPTKSIASSPPKNKPVSPPVVASEDSETYANDAPAPINDATSSDTLTDGHADEPKKKEKTTEAIEIPKDPAPLVSKDSPGEVYEALGRVLSRVGKDSGSTGKDVKPKGQAGDEDDLETLLVALAREARTTSENLGRELDQLRTSAERSPGVTKKNEKLASVVVKEVDTSSPPSPKKTAVVSEVVDRQTKEGKPLRPVTSPPPLVAPRIGAIASLARIDPEKNRLSSFAKVKDQGKGTALSVVVGKCTVARDLNQPGAVSFTSSVSPINPSVVAAESETEKLRKVSTPSAEDPMKAGGGDVTVKKESDKSSMVSAESAMVPIKSGSMGFIVNRESDKTADPNSENLEKSFSKEVKSKEKTGEVTKGLSDHPKKPVGFASAVMKQSEQLKPRTVTAVKDYVKSITLPVKCEPRQLIAAPKPNSEDTSDVGFVLGKESDQSLIAEIAPITASMKLVVRRNAEGLQNLSIPSPLSPRNTGSVANSESMNITVSPSESTTQYATVSTQTNGIKNQTDRDKTDLAITHEPAKEKNQNEESMSPGTVVENIQKEFEQIFAIPAKKSRKSDDLEIPEVSVGQTKTQSLEHQKQSRSPGQLRKTFPKSPASIKDSEPSVEDADKVTIDARKPDAVSSVFEKEFDELWRVSNARKKTDELLDSELERELDQLCSVKMDSQEPVVGSVAGAVVPKGSPESSAQGLEAEVSSSGDPTQPGRSSNLNQD